MDKRNWRPFVYGGLASIIAEFGTFPIDTTKTRLQIQGQAIDKNYKSLKYDGMVDAFAKIYKQEGLKALYSGIWPAVLRQSVYGTIKFGTYYTLKKEFAERGYLIDKSGNESVWGNAACAALAGAVSSAIANPTDVVKVRMQVHGNGGNASQVLVCFKEIYIHEGLRGLWRGIGPTSQRAAIIAGVELPIYDFCKHYLMDSFGDLPANHFISSFIASFGSAVSSTPIDVIRTRLMNQKRLNPSTLIDASNTAHKIYSGSIDCALQTIKNEGLMALYKGFIPTWIRMGPWNVIFFITYEQMKQFY